MSEKESEEVLQVLKQRLPCSPMGEPTLELVYPKGLQPMEKDTCWSRGKT